VLEPELELPELEPLEVLEPLLEPELEPLEELEPVLAPLELDEPELEPLEELEPVLAPLELDEPELEPLEELEPVLVPLELDEPELAPLVEPVEEALPLLGTAHMQVLLEGATPVLWATPPGTVTVHGQGVLVCVSLVLYAREEISSHEDDGEIIGKVRW
jgi:hypothetical protein